MAALSDYAENKLLDVMLGKNDVNFPDINTTYIALFTSPTTDAGGGVEVSGSAYARIALDNNAGAKWVDAVDGVKKNNEVIAFVAASGTWGTITHVGIYTHISASTELLAHGALTTPKTVGNLDVFSFGAGDLQITLD